MLRKSCSNLQWNLLSADLSAAQAFTQSLCAALQRMNALSSNPTLSDEFDRSVHALAF